VVGHSYGARIALQLAYETPAVVLTVGLFDALLLTVPSVQQFAGAIAPIVQRYMAGDRVGAGREFLALVDGPDWREEIGRTVPGGPEQAENDVATLFESDAPSHQEWRFGPEEAAQISQPVSYLLGSDSPPAYAETRDLLRTWLARIEADVLPNANHLLHMRHPAEAAARLVKFLQRHPLSE
jgi:pimeloyl-ACP methyl ester carboxylesterase